MEQWAGGRISSPRKGMASAISIVQTLHRRDAALAMALAAQELSEIPNAKILGELGSYLGIFLGQSTSRRDGLRALRWRAGRACPDAL